MFYKNARIFCSDFRFREGAFEVVDDRFGQILPENVPADAVDLQGAVVIPGLVDVHIHGSVGADASDGDYEGLVRMGRYLASQGVTSFAPTSMTLPYDVLSKAYAVARRVADESPEGCARVKGIHMEGPYFAMSRRGAQNPEYIKNPDFAGFKKLYEDCGGLIRIADLAPELEGAAEFVAQAKELCTVSVAHTDTDYDHAKAAFDAGATHLTHMYNTMPGIHHRNPGPIPAACENPNVRAELICDGLHVHPASMRLAFAMFGADRIVLISDALRCSGMPDGEYELGGQRAYLSGGIAKLANGTIAGSAINLFEGLRRTVSFGIPAEDAVRAAAWNPACAIGAEKEIGSIETGKLADFVVCTADFHRLSVYQGGKKL